MSQLSTDLSRPEKRAQAVAQPSDPPLAVPPREASLLLELGLPQTYQLCRGGVLEFYEDEGTRYITVASINAYNERRQRSKNTVPAAGGTPPLAVSPREAARLLGLGLSHLYNLMRTNELKSFMAGRSRRIVMASLHDYIARRLADNDGKWHQINPPPPELRGQASKARSV
jgi:excisionase family DNA binding protein